MDLDYAGDLSPPEAWDTVKNNKDCLVDCSVLQLNGP